MTANTVLRLIARRKQKAIDDHKEGLLDNDEKIIIIAELMALEMDVRREERGVA